MKADEFDVFLKNIGGLKSGYIENRIIDSVHFFSFNDGWLDVTKQLIEDLIKLGWDREICQAKEKFGGGRFYINTGSDKIFDRIHKWEQDTYHICEDCGAPGVLRDTGWYKTLCGTCRQKQFVSLR